MDPTYRQLRKKLRTVHSSARMWIHYGASPESLLSALKHVHRLIKIRQLPQALLLLDHLLITHKTRSDASTHSSTTQHAA